MNLVKRTWADVDLDRLERNWRQIRGVVPQHAKILGVVKADAYGHGAVPVAQAMTEIGLDYLAVSSFDEALQLRHGAIMLPILILGYTPPEYAQKLAELQITQTVHSALYAQALSERLSGTGRTLDVHVKFDTGMSRLGFSTDDPTIASLTALSHLRVSGAFTHFAVADSLDPSDVAFTRQQYEKFSEAVKKLEDLGAPLELRHCCNSGATVLYPEYAMDMVRPGILLYGVHPSADTEPRLKLEPIMTLRTSISQIREIKAGTSVSYGRTFTAPHDMRVAVLGIGYADGLSRALSGKMRFSLHGKSIPQIGRICMDLCMADVTDVPDAALGDEVTVFGDAPALSAAELAALTDTIPYEAFCVIGKRVPHAYYRGGERVDLLRYIV